MKMKTYSTMIDACLRRPERDATGDLTFPTRRETTVGTCPTQPITRWPTVADRF